MMICGLIIMGLILLWALSGCSTSQEASNKEILWHDSDGCLFVASGLTATQAKEIAQNWDFKECEVRIEGDASSNTKKPE